MLSDGTVPDCLRMGNALGGAACQQPGDWEGLPARDELAEVTGDREVLR